ncbi:zinc-binding oxidoreductase CipB [Hyaloraphidium curvatum]|nr:zinc-binding oxidoreductase CipB [Hyaloraphidium curvatum]
MSTMQAVVLTEKGMSHFEVEATPKPDAPTGKQILIKNKATALNPVDWKMADYGLFIKSFPIVLGCDVGGVVEAVGPEVTRIKAGDRVLVMPPLGTPGAGTFAEYSLGREELALKIPDSMDFGDASTVPVGCYTAVLGLFYKDYLGIAPPSQSSENSKVKLLIWGASSSVGTFAVQLAAAAGFGTIVAVCSEANFDYVKGLGATHVISRKTPIPEILKAHPDLTHVLDAVGEQTSAAALELLKPGGKLVSSAGLPKTGKEGVPMAFIMLGDVYHVPPKLAWLSEFLEKELAPLFGSKVVPSPPKEVVPGGLAGVVPGLEKLKGGVSATKLVVEL